MKRSEAIRKYYKDVASAMVECYRNALESDGQIQYKVYVWEDGELECLEGAQGDNSFLQAREHEPRKLFYVCTVASPCFDPWDYADHPAPEDESQRESERQEIIDSLVQEYETNIANVLDVAMAEAKREENFDFE